MPATFDAAAFAEAGPRIVRLADLGSSYDEETRFFVIRYAEYKLYVRLIGGVILGVLLTPSASMPALRAAAGLVARRAETLLAAEASRAAATVPEPPRFDVDRTPLPDVGAAPRSERRSSLPPSDAPSPSVSLTNTLPSLTLPEAEKPPPGPASKRTIRFRGRSL